MQPRAPVDKYAISADRAFLREKVVTIYDALWRGELQQTDWVGLFHLKVNAKWLQVQIASAPAADLLHGARKPVVRRLVAECLSRLDEGTAADVQCHAMETLSGIFLGVGCRTFHDPVSEVLDLLCGIEAADGSFGKLFGHLKRMLRADRRGAEAAAIRRCAVRLLLSLTAAASDLHRNILVELLMPHGFEQPIVELLQRDGEEDSSGGGGSAAGGGGGSAAGGGGGGGGVRASAIEDVALLLVVLAAYRRHESPNGFLRLLSESSADAPHLQSLATVCRRVLERCMYPAAEASAASSYLGASWSLSLARTAEWAAHALTLEAYLPNAITSQLSSPQALRANAAPLTVALLVAHELTAQNGGATLAALCAQLTESTIAGPGGGGTARRGALLRHLFSVASLLACDARDELSVAQLRLSLLVVERALEGSSSAPLVLSAELGGHLPLWSYSGPSSAVETALASPQPLLAGGYTLLSSLLTQNLRRATFHPPLYLQALALLHRLLVAQHRANQTLPLLKWPALWEALFTLADFLAQEAVFFSARSVPDVATRVLELINLLVALGDSLLPNASSFEAFAYELVRRHATFEKLYRVAKRGGAATTTSAMALARSMIVTALESIGRMDKDALGRLSAAQALDVIRGLNPTIKPEAKAQLLKPPSLMSPHEQLALSHSLLRVLLAHCRQDGSISPLHFEDLV